ncbi:MAG: O-antigen ligase family protein [Ilumatobacteraceae bacterium]|nr:O-antigen ligase family protein [Ilumatobacteraceae bacterium]
MQLSRANSVQIWTWLEYFYVVVLLGLLTQGPVLKIWEASGQIDAGIISNTKFATYLLVQVPAVVLLFRRGIPASLLKGPVGVLLTFCAWMFLSTFWSTFSSYSLVESFTLTVTCLAGLYIARSFTLLQQLTLFLVAMQPGLLISWYAVRNNWSGAVNFDENYWIGIYFNRNSLAPPAALGLLAAGALAWILINRKPKYWFLSTVILVDVMILDLGLLIRSKSSTSLGAIAVFIFVWGFWTAIRWSQRRRSFTSDQLTQQIYPIFLFTLTLLIWLSFRFQARFSQIFKSEIDFNGRTLLWRFSWDGFLDRPIIGWGWFSAWNTPNFFHEREFWWALTSTTWSHSAVMDVLLGGGVIGAGLLILAIVWSGARQLDRVFTQTAGQWTFAATWFVIAASTQESFIVGNHFLWLLLVASMAGSRNEPTQI